MILKCVCLQSFKYPPYHPMHVCLHFDIFSFRFLRIQSWSQDDTEPSHPERAPLDPRVLCLRPQPCHPREEQPRQLCAGRKKLFGSFKAPSVLYPEKMIFCALVFSYQDESRVFPYVDRGKKYNLKDRAKFFFHAGDPGRRNRASLSG